MKSIKEVATHPPQALFIKEYTNIVNVFSTIHSFYEKGIKQVPASPPQALFIIKPNYTTDPFIK